MVPLFVPPVGVERQPYSRSTRASSACLQHTHEEAWARQTRRAYSARRLHSEQVVGWSHGSQAVGQSCPSCKERPVAGWHRRKHGAQSSRRTANCLQKAPTEHGTRLPRLSPGRSSGCPVCKQGRRDEHGAYRFPLLPSTYPLLGHLFRRAGQTAALPSHRNAKRRDPETSNRRVGFDMRH